MITELAEARREAFKEAERLGLELTHELREQHKAGKTIEQLVRETGYSRRQIYNLMERAER
jgi:hypothetical protein